MSTSPVTAAGHAAVLTLVTAMPSCRHRRRGHGDMASAATTAPTAGGGARTHGALTHLRERPHLRERHRRRWRSGQRARCHPCRRWRGSDRTRGAPTQPRERRDHASAPASSSCSPAMVTPLGRGQAARTSSMTGMRGGAATNSTGAGRRRSQLTRAVTLAAPCRPPPINPAVVLRALPSATRQPFFAPSIDVRPPVTLAAPSMISLAAP